MNYTREPIIETVITPREGCKLVVRNSKEGGGPEEYFLDAVEVVSFGNALFFRSQERPKSFLVPCSDYEIVELKETRMVLKNVGIEKIKISGRKGEEREEDTDDDRQKKRRYRRKQTKSRSKQGQQKPQQPQQTTAAAEDTYSSSMLTRLLPPPATLIKEKLGRYKSETESPEQRSSVITEEQESVLKPIPETETKSEEAPKTEPPKEEE